MELLRKDVLLLFLHLLGDVLLEYGLKLAGVSRVHYLVFLDEIQPIVSGEDEVENAGNHDQEREEDVSQNVVVPNGLV